MNRSMPGRLGKSFALLAALLALAAGCGGGDSGGSVPTRASDGGLARTIEGFGAEAKGEEAARLEAALQRYLGARAAGEWARACSGLAESSRTLMNRLAKRSKEIEGEGCVAGMRSFTERQSSSERAGLAKADVESVRVDGSHGYVIYAIPGSSRYAIPATLEGKRWGFAVATVPLD